MTPDLLDDLLDRSAPATRAVADRDLETMAVEARAQGSGPRTRRGRRIAITSGTLALLLIGGAGIAAATDGFRWAPWAQDPVGAVSFTMPNGFDCELRFSEFTAGEDPAFLTEVNGILREWHRSADAVDEIEAFVPKQREQVAETMVESEMEPGADMSVLSPAGEAKEIENRAWAREWLAWDLAVSEVESQELARHGIEPGDPRFVGSERSGQIQCFDEGGDLYIPGADS